MFQHTAGEKGSQHPAQPLGSSTTEQGGLCCWNNDQPCLGFPGRSGTAGSAGRREECVRFRHLRYLIKKTADSISSALQIPLLQEQQPWKTPSAVSSAWKIPKAAKAGVCGKGRRCRPGSERCLLLQPCWEHRAALGTQLRWKPSKSDSK